MVNTHDVYCTHITVVLTPRNTIKQRKHAHALLHKIVLIDFAFFLCFDNGDEIICSCLLNEYFKGQNVHLQLMFPFKIGCSVTGFLLLIRVHRPLVVQ